MVAIPVTDAGGVAFTGLTPGHTYSVWSQGGPWYPTGDSTRPGAYAFALSPDGLVWSDPIGTSNDPWAVSIGSPLSDTYIPTFCNGRTNLDSVHVQITFVATGTTMYIRVGDNPANFGDNTGSLDGELSSGAVPFCTYGTQVQAGVTGGVIVTTALIDAIAIFYGVTGWIIPIFDGFVGKVLYGGDLCAGNPPPLPTFTSEDFLGSTGIPNPASLGKFWQAFEAVAWPYFCQCVAAPIGSPPPIAPPIGITIPPPAAPVGPVTLTCDNADLCTYLQQLNRQMSAVQSAVAQMRSDVTLIQRQGVPFGYVRGTRHSGLTGAGQFAVSDILGLSVQCTTVPSSRYTSTGDPFTYWGLGWIAFGTDDGWTSSHRVSHNPQLLVPDPAGELTLVGYSLGDGVVADLVELDREP